MTSLNITPSDPWGRGGICGSYSYSSRLSGFRESGDRVFHQGAERESHKCSVWLLSVLDAPCAKRPAGKERNHFPAGVLDSDPLEELELLLHSRVREEYVWHPGDSTGKSLGTPLPSFDNKWTNSEA